MHSMNVICFGDSNTYGYDPRGYFGGGYGADCRWVDILVAETGWDISNMGQSGREIPVAAPAFPVDTDLLIVMLGTNDLLQGLGMECGFADGSYFIKTFREIKHCTPKEYRAKFC